ncbi:putative UDP-glucosyltransferase YojK isoform X2 [Convolutriloba macropyga]|uniref:putative UDP-glucosyltransferase YojK isoform X2 n=1 Tax=Convolutriloba macropyga TaxID=536237 RepID=UPI003F524461
MLCTNRGFLLVLFSIVLHLFFALSSADEDVQNKTYNILAVMLCYRGHLNPGSGIIRSLLERKHSVTLFLTNFCSKEAAKLIPNVEQVVEREVLPEHDFDRNFFNQFWNFHKIMHINGTVLLYHEVDEFLKNSKDNPSALMAIAGGFFSGVYDVFISYPIYRSINAIHADNGMEPIEYLNGLMPFGYCQKNVMYIAHGAEPIIQRPGFRLENMIPIGFLPDELMYPALTPKIAQFIEDANGPVIFISLGTVLLKTPEELKMLYEELKSQQNYHFIWAVKTAMLKDLGIMEEPVISERLFMGKYLPQGKILQHWKVKLFVTHCGSNSVQDSVYAMTPMITHPGFGDQVYLSNIIGRLGIGKFMVNFDYKNMKQLIDELLEERVYFEMTNKLELYRKKQIDLGGFAKGAKIIEDVISGKLVVNKDVHPDDVFGINLFGVRATVLGVLFVITLILILVLYIVLRLTRAVLRFVIKSDSSSRKEKGKKD